MLPAVAPANRGRLVFSATVWTADRAQIAGAIHSSGTMARRVQPRAGCQCRAIRGSTVTVRARPTGMEMTPRTFSAERDPSIISRLAGHPGPQLVCGFQKNIETKLWPMVQAYSAATTPTSNLERSRPVGQARARWASAAPYTDATRLPIVNGSA